MKVFVRVSSSSVTLLVIFLVFLSDFQASPERLPSQLTTASDADIDDLINGKGHYKLIVWDPTRKANYVFNISINASLRFVLVREKKGHCEMFFLRFAIKSRLSVGNGSSSLTVCVTELQDRELKKQCYWANDTEDLLVSQGDEHGMPKDCGPWYITVLRDTTLSNSSGTELAVEVSEPYDPLAFRWFRVVSNLAFVPGIVIAFKRGLYAEGIVYFLTFTLSSVYHLCEAELQCFKGYDRLHYSDMYASDLSIIVTIWAMTGIKEPLKHLIYLTIAIALQFLVGETTNTTYHFFVNLIFSVLPICFLLYHFFTRSMKTRSCYPSTRRWIFYLIPGFSLATAGALVNMIVSEPENYYYVHCIWHLTIMLSVAFLLPHKDDDDDEWYCPEDDKSVYTPLI